MAVQNNPSGSLGSLLQQTGISRSQDFASRAFKGHIPSASPAALKNSGTLNLINQSNKLGMGQVPTNVAKGGPRLDIQFLDINNIPLLLTALPVMKADLAEENADRLKELAMDVFRQRGAGPGKAGNPIPGGRPVPWEVSPFTIRNRKQSGAAGKPLFDTGQLVNSLEAVLVPDPDGGVISTVAMSDEIHEETKGRDNRRSGKTELQVAELMAILEEGSSNWKAGGFKWFARVGQALQDPQNDIVKKTAGELLTKIHMFANIDTSDARVLRATQRFGGALARVIREDKPPAGAVVASST